MATEIVERYTVTEDSAKSAFTVYHIVNFFVGVTEIILAFRFVLRMLGANPNSAFTQFIFRLSAPLMAPFSGIFRTTSSEGAVVEWSILVAMAVYAVISYVVLQAVSLIASRTANE